MPARENATSGAGLSGSAACRVGKRGHTSWTPFHDRRPPSCLQGAATTEPPSSSMQPPPVLPGPPRDPVALACSDRPPTGLPPLPHNHPAPQASPATQRRLPAGSGRRWSRQAPSGPTAGRAAAPAHGTRTKVGLVRCLYDSQTCSTARVMHAVPHRRCPAATRRGPGCGTPAVARQNVAMHAGGTTKNLSGGGGGGRVGGAPATTLRTRWRRRRCRRRPPG